jgi:hypothetical protein
MSGFWPAVITFSTGAIFTWFELRTSKYPNTGFLISFKRPFLIYCGIYGIIALAGFLLSDLLLTKGTLKIEGVGADSFYIRAIVIGFSSKAIMQLNLYTVTTGSTAFPIGFQTFAQLFEPYLLRSILLEEFNEVRKFVLPFVTEHPLLPVVKDMISQNIPISLSQQERAAFENEIAKDQQVHVAMERFLRFLGPGTFRRVF